MGKTNISWADYTLNGWIGCTKVSAGCDRCYAEVAYVTKMKGVQWGKGAPRYRTTSTWKDPIKWNKTPLICDECGHASADGFCKPCSCTGGIWMGTHHRARVFSASLSDWLDDEVPIEWLADLLKLVHDTPNLDWLLLSKRIENFFPRIRLVLDLLDKKISTGYAVIYEATPTKRANSLSGNHDGGTGNRRAGKSLAREEKDIRPVERRNEDDAVQTSESGDTKQGWLSSSPDDARRQTSGSSSTSTGVVLFQRHDTAGIDCESQERVGGQSGQSTRQSGAGDLQPTATSCDQGFGSAARRHEGREEPEAPSDGCSRDATQKTTRQRGARISDGERSRNDAPSGLGNLPRADVEALAAWLSHWLNGDPPENVWIGTTCENQAMANKRIPLLLQIPAIVRFISAEPLLEKIQFPNLVGIHQVIFGGESGPISRPMNVDWIRSGIQQCRDGGVKVFVKQLGSQPVIHSRTEDADGEISEGSFCDPPTCTRHVVKLKDSKGGEMSEWPTDLRVREFPNE